MRRLTAIPILLAGLLPLAAPASAAQYEAVLLPERSLRYQTSFGLFADDYEGFIQPRRSTRWDADRMITQLANLAPEGNAALGYGNASTDAWSLTVLGSGGYRYENSGERVDSLRLLETDNGLLQTQQSTRLPGATPRSEGEARLAVGLGSELGGGQFGIGLQALWSDVSVGDASVGPGLFTFTSPAGGAAESTELSSLIERDGGSQTVSLTSDPRTDSESLRAGLVTGYLKAPREPGWGWGVDVLGGVERL